MQNDENMQRNRNDSLHIIIFNYQNFQIQFQFKIFDDFVMRFFILHSRRKKILKSKKINKIVFEINKIIFETSKIIFEIFEKLYIFVRRYFLTYL